MMISPKLPISKIGKWGGGREGSEDDEVNLSKPYFPGAPTSSPSGFSLFPRLPPCGREEGVTSGTGN